MQKNAFEGEKFKGSRSTSQSNVSRSILKPGQQHRSTIRRRWKVQPR